MSEEQVVNCLQKMITKLGVQPRLNTLLTLLAGSARTRINLLGLFLVHQSTCGKRESVSLQHSLNKRRAVGLLNPMRNKSWRQEPAGEKGRHL